MVKYVLVRLRFIHYKGTRTTRTEIYLLLLSYVIFISYAPCSSNGSDQVCFLFSLQLSSTLNG